MQNRIREHKIQQEPLGRVDANSLAWTLSQHRKGVSYNLFLPKTEKGNVVDMESKARIKRVSHALHNERHSAEDVSTKAVVKVEGKQVCSEGSLS